MVAGNGVANPIAAIGAMMFTMSMIEQMMTPDPFDIRAAELGAEIVRRQLPFRHVEMDMVGHIAASVAFEGGYDVVDSLDGMGRAVIVIIQRFLHLTH
jgi:hypothetical protein